MELGGVQTATALLEGGRKLFPLASEAMYLSQRNQLITSGKSGLTDINLSNQSSITKAAAAN